MCHSECHLSYYIFLNKLYFLIHICDSFNDKTNLTKNIHIFKMCHIVSQLKLID